MTAFMVVKGDILLSLKFWSHGFLTLSCRILGVKKGRSGRIDPVLALMLFVITLTHITAIRRTTVLDLEKDGNLQDISPMGWDSRGASAEMHSPRPTRMYYGEVNALRGILSHHARAPVTRDAIMTRYGVKPLPNSVSLNPLASFLKWQGLGQILREIFPVHMVTQPMLDPPLAVAPFLRPRLPRQKRRIDPPPKGIKLMQRFDNGK